MYTILYYLFGAAGTVLGYYIPYFSFKIMEYKKGEGNIRKSNNLLYSKSFQLILCLFNGIIWYVAAIKLNNPFSALLIGMMITAGIIVAFIDVSIRIIPNELILIMLVIGFIFQTVNYGFKSLIGALISMVIMMIVFISVAGFVGFGKIGAGDVKLAAAMGLSLGYPLIITAVLIMAAVLFVYILAGLLLKKIYMSTMLPLAPFMISGFIFSLITLLI